MLQQKLILTWFVTLMSASLAHAELSCPNYVPQPFSSIETKVDMDGEIFEGKNIDCKNIGVAADMVLEIRDMLSSEIKVPKSMPFRIADSFGNAFFNPEDLSLNIPFQLILGKHAKHPVHTIPVWAHEYGHAILNANLRDVASAWTDIVRKKADESAGRPEQIIDFLVAPYHEFFADVVAVLYTEEGDSVARSLTIVGFVENPEGTPAQCPNSDKKCRPREGSRDTRDHFRNRDFTERANELHRWKPVQAEDIHNILAPARYHAWKYYLSNPNMRRDKAKIAAVVIDAIIADVNDRIARMSDSEGGITASRMEKEFGDVVRTNEEFIGVLDAYFEAAF
jgi:hypothetical protein